VIVGRSEGERGEIKWYDHEVKGRLTLKIDRGTLKAYFQDEEKVINLLDLGYIYTWVSEKISSSNRYIGVWASLNFHEFVFNAQPLGFTGVTGKPVHTPPPL